MNKDYLRCNKIKMDENYIHLSCISESGRSI